MGISQCWGSGRAVMPLRFWIFYFVIYTVYAIYLLHFTASACAYVIFHYYALFFIT